MKKLLLILALCLIPSLAFGQTNWVTTNQVTVEWNQTTTLVGGAPCPVGDTIFYRVYTAKLPQGPVEVVGDTPNLEYTITFTSEGRYLVGVEAVRIPQGETDEFVSGVLWSDNEDEALVPNPFGLKFFVNPSEARGLRPR